MADPRFYTSSGPLSLKEIAARTGSTLAEGADGGLMIHDVATLGSATKSDISFLMARKYLGAFRASSAGACFVMEEFSEIPHEGMALLICDNPQMAYAATAVEFYPTGSASGELSASATIDPSTRIGEGTAIHAGAVIEAGVEIGRGCSIGANTVVGAGVEIGDGCRIAPNVTITHALIGRNVTIHAGARIGQDGFGYVPGPQGHRKVPQLGRVLIGDEVEIGANTTIDRGATDDTVIGDGTKIDNLVQIAHNSRIGRQCILCGQSGLAGSVTLEDGVVIGGQVAVADHVHIESGVHVGGKSGVTRRIPTGTKVMGYPAKAAEDWRFEQSALRQLGRDIRKKRSLPTTDR